MSEILTSVEKAIQEYGVENIFMVNADYHGKHEDDYCRFTYYNNITASYFFDEWTTAFACPSYSRFECMTMTEAKEKGLLNLESFLKLLKIQQKMERVPVNMLYERNQYDNLGLRINVSKGRKWKGTGYWIGTRSTSYHWGVQLWKSDNGYGTTTTTYCKIYDPMTGRIEYINTNNCHLIDENALKEQYIQKYNEALSHCTVNDIIIGRICCLKVNIESFPVFVKNNTTCPDISDAFDEFEYERKKKMSEFRTKKMNDLIEWVKTNTDKEGDDILKLAEGIYRKQYM